ncbi:MAG TPA: ChaN family lipoprotein [Noviherbaspirillum sp.]
MKDMNMLGKRLFLFLLAPLLAACAHMSEPALPWHPLVDKVWDVSARRFVDPVRVMERAAESRYVLIGEIHDNAEHHRIQNRILESLVMRGRRPALVMEQYDIDQQEKLNGIALNKESSVADKLGGLRQQLRGNWEWRFYEPMVARALSERLPVIAANMPRESLRTVAREGYGVLGVGEEARLMLPDVWSDARQAQLAREIINGHCGKIPEHVVDYVTRSQRARDAIMADKMLMAKRNGVVGIVGRNHARMDIGIPLYLAARAPDDPVLSIGLVEVDTPTDPEAYAASKLGQLHDYLWFTTRPRRTSNPCDSIPDQPKAAS